MRDTIEEQWRPIEGYEGYEVSNLGRVRSLDRIDSRGNRLKGRILRPVMDRVGYLLVNLWKEGKRKTFLVHRLVAQAFIPNPEGLPQINHKNEIKTDNRIENLEWCTRSYNVNYGTCKERATKSRLHTRISNGTYDSELCGIEDEKEYKRLYYQKNKDRFRERRAEYMRKYWIKKKQEKKKDNRPSEESLW